MLLPRFCLDILQANLLDLGIWPPVGGGIKSCSSKGGRQAATAGSTVEKVGSLGRSTQVPKITNIKVKPTFFVITFLAIKKNLFRPNLIYFHFGVLSRIILPKTKMVFQKPRDTYVECEATRHTLIQLSLFLSC